VPLYYIEHLGGDPLVASFFLSFFLGAGVIGTLFGGALSDRFGSKRVMLATITPIPLFLYLFQQSTGVGMFVTLGLAGASLAAANTSSLALVQRLLPDNLAMASGINLGLSAGLSAIGIILLGNVADAQGVEAVFTILAILPVWGFVMTLMIKEPDK
jgi:FSR family fosmidomycin resistance protein-like MFS transporter